MPSFHRSKPRNFWRQENVAKLSTKKNAKKKNVVEKRCGKTIKNATRQILVPACCESEDEEIQIIEYGGDINDVVPVVASTSNHVLSNL